MNKQRNLPPASPALDTLIQLLAERAVADYLTQQRQLDQQLTQDRTERAALLQVKDAA